MRKSIGIKKKKESTVMENTNISAPWVTHYHMIEALFKDDPEITVEYDKENTTVKLFVRNQDKAEALTKLMPTEVPFGNVKLRISVIPANTIWKPDDYIRKAFVGNPIFDDVCEVGIHQGATLYYALFKKEVIKFFDDNLGDPHGNVFTLAQDIAKNVLTNTPAGVFYSTSEV